MICSKCGAENPENVTFCTQCGEALAKPVNSEEKRDPTKKKRWIRFIAMAAGVICLILIVFSVLSGNGAESTAEDFCKALKEMELNTALSILPPAVLDYAADSLDLDNLKYEVIRSEELDDDAVRNIDERYALRFGTEDGYISSAYVVYLRAAVSGRSVSRANIPLVMVEIDGDWYLDPLTTADKIDEADWYEDAFHINWN